MAINYNNDPYNQGIGNLDTDIFDDNVAFKPASFFDNQIKKLQELENMGYPQPNLQDLKDRDMKQFKKKGIPLSLPEGLYADAYSTPTDGAYGFNLIELDKLEKYGYDPQEVQEGGYGKDLLRSLEPTANANNIMTDFSYDNGVSPEISKLINQPQNTFQGVQGVDIDDSWNEAYDLPSSRFQNFKSSIGSGIDSIRNNRLTRGIGAGYNFLKANVPGMLMSGLGAIMNRDPNAPSYQQYSPGVNYNNLNSSMINDFYDSNKNSNTFGTNRFDRAKTAFGKSRTLFGPNGIAATKAKMAQEAQAAAAVNAAINTSKEQDESGGGVTYNPAITTPTLFHPSQGNRDNNVSSPTNSPGHPSRRANGGRIRYSNGGLASLWPR